jgi:shikimate kinase
MAIKQNNLLARKDKAMKATLTFHSMELAKDFASKWTRHTLTGHTMSAVKPNGIVTVDVCNIDEAKKVFINSYVNDTLTDKGLIIS